MAVYQSNQPDSLSALLGQSLGGGLGAGLSTGLQQLAEHKVQQYQQQQQSQRLAPIAQRLGMPGAEVLGEQGLARLLQQRQKQEYEQGLMNQYNQIKTGTSPAGAQSGAQQQGQPLQQQVQAAPQTEEDIRAKYAPQLAAADQFMGVRPDIALRDKANIMQQMNSELKGWQATQKREALKRKETREIEEQEFKELQPIRKAQQQGLQDLKRNSEARSLIEQGDFTSPILVSFYENLPQGLANSLITADTAKLKAMGPGQFLSSIKPIYGPQISDSDIKLMYDAIVSASSPKESNLAILDFMDKLAENSVLKGKILDQTEEKYPDKSVFSKLKIVDQKYSKELEKRSKEAREALPPATSFQNRYLELENGKVKKSNGKEWLDMPGKMVNGMYRE